MNVLKKLKSIIKRRILCENRGVALMYHRVIDMPFDPWELAVSPRNFEEQMKVLKKFGKPVQLQEMGKKVNSFSFGSKQIAVTFDDGYADNFYNAKPILERYEIPATFFITTGMIDTNEEYWWDELEKTILQAEHLPEHFKMTINNNDHFWTINPDITKETHNYSFDDAPIPNGSLITRNQLYFILWAILTHLSFEEKRAVLSRILLWAGQPIPRRISHKIMSKEELLELSRVKLFEIGSHTQHHPMLSYLNTEDQRNEIQESKIFLEKTLDRPIESFSYPHGAYTSETVKIVEELGFKASCTVTARQVSRNDSPLQLPRFAVLNWNGQEFERKLRTWMGDN
jgi:peptidoglycan/xylan/chitin deacetylase (PgdA/CDA1 family)